MIGMIGTSAVSISAVYAGLPDSAGKTNAPSASAYIVTMAQAINAVKNPSAMPDMTCRERKPANAPAMAKAEIEE